MVVGDQAALVGLAGFPVPPDAGGQGQQLDLKAGSVYPILMRLADRGLLETAWERDVPAGRPPRHLYRLTGPGRVLAAELAAAPPAPAKAARVVGGIGRRPRLEGT